jgi:hypothetical protein
MAGSEISLEPEMPLNNDDRKWIASEIKKATQPFNDLPKRINDAITDGAQRITDAIERGDPHGWRKAVRLLRELGPLATIIAIFVALLGVTLGAVYQSFSHVKEETEFRTNAKDRLGAIESQMVALRALIASTAPTRPQNQNAAKQLLAEASKGRIPAIPSTIVEEAGSSFVAASAQEPAAWPVALQFIGYRTSLNNSLVQLSQYKPIDNNNSPPTRFLNRVPDGKSLPRMSSLGGPVPISESARMEPIGSALPQTAEIGTKSVLEVGGAITLDGQYLRHVVLKDVEVHYSGSSPVILEDVMFINCTFVMENDDRTRALGETLLSSS